MTKTWLSRLAMFAAASVAIAGIGGAKAQDQITLNWALWDWAATAYYQPLIDAYEATHPNVKIEYTDLGSTDYSTVLQTQLSGGGTDFDIVTIKDIPGYTNLIAANLILPLDDFIKEQGIDTSAYGGVVEALALDGKVYGLPFRSDFWLVYYNKDIFDKAGVAYPTNDMTLAQFDELARSVTSGFGADKVYGTHFHVWRSTVELPSILDGQHTVIADDYSFMKPYYERVLALQNDGIIQSYAALKTSNTHYSGPFYNQQIATLPMGSWFIATQIAKVTSGESKAVNWGIVKFPHPDGVAAGTTAATITALSVPVNSTQQEAALDFVEFVSGPEGAAVVARTGTFPAIANDEIAEIIASTPGFPSDPASKEALVTGQRYLEMPVDPKAPEIEVVLNRAHDEIMTDNISVDDGLAQMTAGVAALR